jgi:hypothetical protein
MEWNYTLKFAGKKVSFTCLLSHALRQPPFFPTRVSVCWANSSTCVFPLGIFHFILSAEVA